MKLRLAVNVPNGVVAAYIDPETRESVRVKKLYFDKSVEVNDYDALHLLKQNKKSIVSEQEWQKMFGQNEGAKLNPEAIDKKSAAEHILSLSDEGLNSLYSKNELREFMKKAFEITLPTTVKNKKDVINAIRAVAKEVKRELEEIEKEQKTGEESEPEK